MDPDHPARPRRRDAVGDQPPERLTLGLVRLRTSTTHRNSPDSWVLRPSPESALPVAASTGRAWRRRSAGVFQRRIVCGPEAGRAALGAATAEGGDTTMAEHPTATLIRAMIDAMNRGDMQGASDALAEDVEWHEIGRADARHGKAELRAALNGGASEYTTTW